MKIAYSHLKRFFKVLPSKQDLSNHLFQLGHEHTIKDGIFDIEFTPNRGDCLSLLGISRDLNPFFQSNLLPQEYKNNINEFSLDFENNVPEICPSILFLKLKIKGDIKKYKDYLSDYFKDLNLSKINFFTDVSNFLSYEIGQPTHCYDFKKLSGKISLNQISKEVKFSSLVNKEIILNGKNTVFNIGEKVINLAGVMGGIETACSKDTSEVLVECAYFKPEEIIGKSLKYDLSSESSYKFERGVDQNIQEFALRRFIKIVEDHANIESIELFNREMKLKNNNLIKFSPDKINKILGTSINDKLCKDILESLRFKVSNVVEIPSYREDIKTQNDIAEEVARVIGYDNIKSKKISGKKEKQNQFIGNKENLIRQYLTKNGFSEVINNPFVSNKHKKSISVLNPLDKNKNNLRLELKHSLIENLLYNERRQKDSIKFFEISDIYYFNDKLKSEKKLAIICSGRIGKNHKDFSRKIDEKYLQNILYQIAPNEISKITKISRSELDTKIKSEIIYFEVNLDLVSHETIKTEYSSDFTRVKYVPVSEFPFMYRDISFSLNNSKAFEELEMTIRSFSDNQLKEIFIFDFFKNEKRNQLKIGYRFIFQSSERTLKDEDVDLIINKIIDSSLQIEGLDVPGYEVK